MAKPPAWLKVSAPRVEGNKMVVIAKVRRWHPAFWRVMWGMFRQDIRRRGRNPNHPRMLWFVGRQIFRVVTRKEL